MTTSLQIPSRESRDITKNM